MPETNTGLKLVTLYKETFKGNIFPLHCYIFGFGLQMVLIVILFTRPSCKFRMFDKNQI